MVLRSRGRSRTRRSSRKRSRAPGSYSRSVRKYRKGNEGPSAGTMALTKAAAGVAGVAGGPYVGALANALASYINSRSTKSSTVATGSGQGMGTRINRKKVSMKKKKKRTIIKRSVVEAKGIINNTEIKWISKTNSPESVKFEAVAVAHTTMPIKASLLNLCRAMVKYTAQRLNIDIRDLAQPPPNFNNGRVGFEYFVGYNSTVPVYTLTTIALPTLCGTWDEYAYRLYVTLTGLAGNLDEIRFVNFFGADFATTAGHQYPNFTCAVGDLKVQVCTSSVMKIQNRTVNTVGDADATEVDNVPLHGAHFMLKGNNVTRKSNWTQFFGAFEGDETVLFRTFPANGAIWDTNHDQPYIASPVDAVSINPNDLPKKSELSNCLSSETFVHNPGVIRSSYISQSYEMTVIAYLNLLLGTRGQVNNILAYNPRCGKTAAIWYDKVIGNVPQGNTTDVSIVLECQYRSGVYVFGKSKVKTLPLNFQFGAVEA